MGQHILPEDLDLSSDVEDLKEILTTVEPRLQPIPQIRSHVSRFVDGADMDEVYPKLWLGDCDAATNIPYLKKNRITHILNAADNKTGPARVKTGKEFYKDTKFIYKGLDLIDLPFANVAKFFDESAYFINEALLYGGTVLVHCRQGKSRSASIVIAFLMLRRNYTAARALRRLKEIRDIRPNNSFLQQIADLDLALFRKRLELHRSKLNSLSDSDSDDSDSEKSNSRGASSLNSNSSLTGRTQLNGHFYSCSEYSTEASICLVMPYDDSDEESDSENGERTPKYSEVSLEKENDAKCFEKSALKNTGTEADDISVEENKTLQNVDVECPRKLSLKYAVVESDMESSEEMALKDADELDFQSIDTETSKCYDIEQDSESREVQTLQSSNIDSDDENLDKWALKFAEFKSSLEDREMLECSEVQTPDVENIYEYPLICADVKAANVESLNLELKNLDEESEGKIFINLSLENSMSESNLENEETILGQLNEKSDAESMEEITFHCAGVKSRSITNQDSDPETDFKSINEETLKSTCVKLKFDSGGKFASAGAAAKFNIEKDVFDIKETALASPDVQSSFESKAIAMDDYLNTVPEFAVVDKRTLHSSEVKPKSECIEKLTLNCASSFVNSKLEGKITHKKLDKGGKHIIKSTLESSDVQSNLEKRAMSLDDFNIVSEREDMEVSTLRCVDVNPKFESVEKSALKSASDDSNSKLVGKITRKKVSKGVKSIEKPSLASSDVQSNIESEAIVLADANTLSEIKGMEESTLKSTDIKPKFESCQKSALKCSGGVCASMNEKEITNTKLDKDAKGIKTALANSDVQSNFESKAIVPDVSSTVSEIEDLKEVTLKSTEVKLKFEDKKKLALECAGGGSFSKTEREITSKKLDKGVNGNQKPEHPSSDVQSKLESKVIIFDEANKVSEIEDFEESALTSVDDILNFENGEKSALKWADGKCTPVSNSKFEGEITHLKKLNKGIKGNKKIVLASLNIQSNLENKAKVLDVSNIVPKIENIEESTLKLADVKPKCAGAISDSKYDLEMNNKKLNKGVKGIMKSALVCSDVQSNCASQAKALEYSSTVSEIEDMKESTLRSADVKPKWQSEEKPALKCDGDLANSKFEGQISNAKLDKDVKVMKKSALVSSEVQSNFSSNEISLDDSSTVSEMGDLEESALKSANVEPKLERGELSALSCASGVSNSKFEGEISHKKLTKGVKGIKKTSLTNYKVQPTHETKAIVLDVSNIVPEIAVAKEYTLQGSGLKSKFESKIDANSKSVGETTFKKLDKSVKGVMKSVLATSDVQSNTENNAIGLDDSIKSTFNSLAVKPKFESGEKSTFSSGAISKSTFQK